MANDELLIQVPSDLGRELINAGFDEAMLFKGVDASMIVNIVISGLSVAANFTTVVADRSEITKFVATLRAWMRRKPRNDDRAAATVDLSIRQGENRTEIRLQIVSDGDGLSIDPAQATAVLNSLLTRKPIEASRNADPH